MDLLSMFFILVANTLLTGLIFYLNAKEGQLKFLSAESKDQMIRHGEN